MSVSPDDLVLLSIRCVDGESKKISSVREVVHKSRHLPSRHLMGTACSNGGGGSGTALKKGRISLGPDLVHLNAPVSPKLLTTKVSFPA